MASAAGKRSFLLFCGFPASLSQAVRPVDTDGTGNVACFPVEGFHFATVAFGGSGINQHRRSSARRNPDGIDNHFRADRGAQVAFEISKHGPGQVSGRKCRAPGIGFSERETCIHNQQFAIRQML